MDHERLLFLVLQHTAIYPYYFQQESEKQHAYQLNVKWLNAKFTVSELDALLFLWGMRSDWVDLGERIKRLLTFNISGSILRDMTYRRWFIYFIKTCNCISLTSFSSNSDPFC